MTSLFLAIEETEIISDERNDCYKAICALSKNKNATRFLLDALIYYAFVEEKKWQEIEHRADYQAKYTERGQAREDFLHKYFSE